METALEKLTAGIFAEHVHTTFNTQLGDARIVLELSSVVEHELSARQEAFSLVFRGPVTPRLPQKIYRLEHEKLGTFSIFLTAIEGDADGISYEAVFNRVRKNK